MKHIRRYFPIILLPWCITLVSTFDIISSLSIGTVIRVQEALYFIHTSNKIGDLSGSGSETAPNQGIELITSVHLSPQRSVLSENTLKEQLSRYTSDDVWSEDFLDGIAVSGGGDFQLDLSAVRWMKENGIKCLYLSGHLADDNVKDMDLQGITLVQLSTTIPPGPYAILIDATARTIHDVYLLLPDVYEAFVFGIIPNGDSWIQTNFTFANFVLTANRDVKTPAQYIPVPSRLRSLDDDILPLVGKRFVVKDIFDMRGVTTTAGSAAYAKVHGTANETAPSIQALIDFGAVPVGKTRTSQFAHGANPWEFEDFAYSWNPRGDGYLTAMSSSSGSACAIAGYRWIDFAVGSDTRGSVRKPASVVGVYGIRPSFGSLTCEGVVPLAEELDTIGFFARDPELFHDLASLWYADSPIKAGSAFSSLPRQLLYPYDHFPVKNPAAQSIYEDFIDTLCEQLGLTKIPVNITDKLLPYLPEGSFSQFKRYADILAEYHSWNFVGKPLTEAYQHLFGQTPSLDPVPQFMYSRAKDLTVEDYRAAVSFKNKFTESMSRDLFKANPDSCSESILVYDTGMGGSPSYRVESFNSYPGATDAQTVLKPGRLPRFTENLHYITSMGGLVEVTLPLGQVEYHSYVSGEWEVLPVSVQLVTRRGCDGVLLGLVKELAHKNVVEKVMTGKALFPQVYT